MACGFIVNKNGNIFTHTLYILYLFQGKEYLSKNEVARNMTNNTTKNNMLLTIRTIEVQRIHFKQNSLQFYSGWWQILQTKKKKKNLATLQKCTLASENILNKM